MKRFLVIIMMLLISSSLLLGGTSSTSELRKLFHTAVLDHKFIPSFVMYVDGIEDPTPIELAYQAAALALQAQEEWNPIEKYSYLKKFKRLITKAIERDSNEIEIRFLRFGIEHHIPPFFGFSTDMEDDKAAIISTVSKIERFEIDQYFSIYILNLLSDSGLCSDEEIELVRSKIQS